MSQYSKSLHYVKNGATLNCCLYTSTDDIGEQPYLSINDNGATVYAPLVDTSDSDASDIRVRHNGTTYAVAHQYSVGDPEPGLLLQRTRAGTHTQHYSVGDTFDIVLNGTVSDDLSFNNETWRAVIIGFDHNAALETGGAYSTTLAICRDTSATGLYSATNCLMRAAGIAVS